MVIHISPCINNYRLQLLLAGLFPRKKANDDNNSDGDSDDEEEETTDGGQEKEGNESKVNEQPTAANLAAADKSQVNNDAAANEEESKPPDVKPPPKPGKGRKGTREIQNEIPAKRRKSKGSDAVDDWWVTVPKEKRNSLIQEYEVKTICIGGIKSSVHNCLVDTIKEEKDAETIENVLITILILIALIIIGNS